MTPRSMAARLFMRGIRCSNVGEGPAPGLVATSPVLSRTAYWGSHNSQSCAPALVKSLGPERIRNEDWRQGRPGATQPGSAVHGQRPLVSPATVKPPVRTGCSSATSMPTPLTSAASKCWRTASDGGHHKHAWEACRRRIITAS